MTKLDEILRKTTRPTETVNAPYGIGAIGGTLLNPTVNNYGPAPANLTFTEKQASDPVASKSGVYLLKVHIKTDRSMPGAVIGVQFSGEVEISKDDGNQEGPRLANAPIAQVDIGSPLATNGISIPNSYGFTINAPYRLHS